ncbi:MAG: hypothetical protein A3J72_05955 [Nitrospirae bacterium RIFCSPHIGHO2_02_FULL_40_19]|nr:MAG: hypothetical protein A3J72_05955 [Nitrospirae bacterium RIFCSPHIGHO2_02_FULL_40_19]
MKPFSREAVLEYLTVTEQIFWETSSTLFMQNLQRGSYKSLQEMKEFSNYDSEEERQADIASFKRNRALFEEIAKFLYQNFWSAPLETRTVIAKELLINKLEDGKDFDALFAYAIDMTIRPGSKYHEGSRELLRSYVNALEPYQRHLALAAMMVASEKTSHSGATIGEALAVFLENVGPAETKAGQCAESHPDVPEEISKDLKRLKFHADEPYRWNILNKIKCVRSNIVQSYNANLELLRTCKGDDLDQDGNVYIKRVGDIIGSGSLYVAVELLMSDGTIQVLSLLRDYANERAEAGFSTMRKMTDDLKPTNPARPTLQELMDQGKRKLSVETNCKVSPIQYEKACEIYNGTTVSIGDETFTFHSAKVTAPGENFFMMDKINGLHFLELPEKKEDDLQKKRKLAMAILTLELNNILRGEFDNDRHGGNIKVEDHKIGHFDFKAMSLTNWQQEGYDQFAEILFNIVLKAKSVTEFVGLLLAEQKAIRAKGLTIDPFVIEAQKGLLSLGEYTRCLEPQDLQRVLLSALSQGMNEKMKSAVEKQISKLSSLARVPLRKFIQDGTIPPFIPFPIAKDEIILINRTA